MESVLRRDLMVVGWLAGGQPSLALPPRHGLRRPDILDGQPLRSSGSDHGLAGRVRSLCQGRECRKSPAEPVFGLEASVLAFVVAPPVMAFPSGSLA